MSRTSLQKYLTVLLVFFSVWLFFKYVLGLVTPFLLGLVIAAAAEPAVRFLSGPGRLPRAAAAGIGVSGALLFTLALAGLLCAAAVKELGSLIRSLPDMQDALRQGLILLQDGLIRLADRTPEAIRPLLGRYILELFSSGTALLDRAAAHLPGAVSNLLGHLPGSALGIGTGILAGFLISARLPGIRNFLSLRIPQNWRSSLLPALRRVRKTLGAWILAQSKLSVLTWMIVTLGFLLLKIPFAPLWALPVALVDAVPLLGTGTVLIPWAVLMLLRQQLPQALGLLAVYGTAAVTRTVLEPRLVGRHLGLDPLATLIFLYLGYRLWGFWGMVFSPMLAAAVKSVFDSDS